MVLYIVNPLQRIIAASTLLKHFVSEATKYELNAHYTKHLFSELWSKNMSNSVFPSNGDDKQVILWKFYIIYAMQNQKKKKHFSGKSCVYMQNLKIHSSMSVYLYALGHSRFVIQSQSIDTFDVISVSYLEAVTSNYCFSF